MTNISFEKIARQAEAERRLERDIRNQVVIDQFKRLTWKDRAMFYWEINGRRWCIWFCVIAWVMIALVVRSHAETCPTPGEKCKVIYLTEQEEKMLMGQNGILDTAAQARALDLGQFVVYLKTRINGAVQGEVQPSPSGSGSASPPVQAPPKP